MHDKQVRSQLNVAFNIGAFEIINWNDNDLHVQKIYNFLKY